MKGSCFSYPFQNEKDKIIMHLFIRLSQEQEINVDCLVNYQLHGLKSTLFDQDFNKNFDFNSRTIHLGITEILENVSNQ